MDAGRITNLISVKKTLLRHPLVIGAGAASLVALLALNATAFMQGLQAPWLLGSVIIADMFVIGVGVLVAAREVLTAEHGAEAVRHALEESEARLAAIVEWSEDAIIAISLEGVIQSWNRGAEKTFGYTREEAIGRPITLIIPEERRSEEKDVLARIGRGETMEHFETVRCARDGRRLDISLTVSPILDATGRIVAASKIARDVTRRRQAEAEAERMQSALTGKIGRAHV